MVRNDNTKLCLMIQNRDLVGPRVPEGSPTSPDEDSSKHLLSRNARWRLLTELDYTR